MRRKEDKPLHKTTLNLVKGDFEKLQEAYPRLGAGKVVRELVNAHVRRIEEQAQQHFTELTIEPEEILDGDPNGD